jgi:hypothetical protein
VFDGIRRPGTRAHTQARPGEPRIALLVLYIRQRTVPRSEGTSRVPSTAVEAEAKEHSRKRGRASEGRISCQHPAEGVRERGVSRPTAET